MYVEIIDTNRVNTCFPYLVTTPTNSIHERIIPAATDVDDTVLFPFLGSGAGAVSAKLNDREYIGIERNSDYIEMAERLLDEITEKPDMVAAVRDTST